MAKDFKGARAKALQLTQDAERIAQEAVTDDGINDNSQENNNQSNVPSNVASNKASNVSSNKANKQTTKKATKKAVKKDGDASEQQDIEQQNSQQQGSQQGDVMEGSFAGSEIRGSSYQDVPTKGVQVRMPEDIYMGLSLYKLQHRGVTLQELVIKACKEWLDRNTKK